MRAIYSQLKPNIDNYSHVLPILVLYNQVWPTIDNHSLSLPIRANSNLLQTLEHFFVIL